MESNFQLEAWDSSLERPVIAVVQLTRSSRRPSLFLPLLESLSSGVGEGTCFERNGSTLTSGKGSVSPTQPEVQTRHATQRPGIKSERDRYQPRSRLDNLLRLNSGRRLVTCEPRMVAILKTLGHV